MRISTLRKKDLFGEKKFVIEIKRFNTAHDGRPILKKINLDLFRKYKNVLEIAEEELKNLKILLKQKQNFYL